MPESFSSLKHLLLPRSVVEYIVVEGHNPSHQRNEAAKRARGDILLFLDDDSRVPGGLIERILGHFDDEKVIVVGGPSLTPDDDVFLQKCFGHALASSFGTYKSSARYSSRGHVRTTTDTELIGCNLAVRRKIFLDEGGLNIFLHPNEENEFLDRLFEKGYKMIYDPKAFVYRSQRKTIGEFLAQIFGYGGGRVDQTLLRPSRIKPFYFAPLIFSLYLCLLPLIIGQSWAVAPLGLYFLCAFTESIRIAWKNGDWRLFPSTPVIFLSMHMSHGFGLLWGLVSRLIVKRPDLGSSDVRVVHYESCDRLPTA